MIRRVAYHMYLFITGLLVIAMACGAAWMMHNGVAKLPLRQYFSASYTNAIWDWSNPAQKNRRSLQETADFMYLHQLNIVFVNTSSYASIPFEQDGSKRRAQRDAFEASLTSYIAAMQKRNVKVFAAVGDPNWSDPTKRHIPLAILQAAQDYNKRHPATRLAGVEFDIEAYNQKDFTTGSMTVKSLILGDYLDMVDELATANAQYTSKTKQSFELGFAIPYWFDNENGNIPTITWHDRTGPTLYHLLDRLNQLPESNVVVMAYRNAARGNDGIIYHARTEIEYAQARARKVKVIVGQEVNEVEPAKITYYGSSATELSSQVKLMEDEFRSAPAFAGMAINDLTGYQAMEDGER